MGKKVYGELEKGGVETGCVIKHKWKGMVVGVRWSGVRGRAGSR